MTHIEVRMACLKLALGDATPRTAEAATAHVAVAETYARFLLGQSASGPDTGTATAALQAMTADLANESWLALLRAQRDAASRRGAP